jgi:hypothetical protein
MQLNVTLPYICFRRSALPEFVPYQDSLIISCITQIMSALSEEKKFIAGAGVLPIIMKTPTGRY